MRTKNFGEFYARRYLQIEGTLDNESGVLADGESVRKLVIGAAIRNSFSGQFVEDLHSAVQVSAALGREFGNRLSAIGLGRPSATYL